MNINIQTKYNISDIVYIINEESKCRNWYSANPETEWRVLKEDYGKRQYIKLMIEEIIIEYNCDNYNIYYIFGNYKIKEDNLFSDLEKAKEKCIELNRK